MLKIKKQLIKAAMKLFEVVPGEDNLSLNEIFNRDSFIDGTPEEREKLMLASSQYRYDYENKHPWDVYFGVSLGPLLKGKKLLDLGCFTGGRTVAWAERYGPDEIYGIDVNQVYIDAAELFSGKKKINAGFLYAGGEKLPFEDESFDAILSYHVLEHVQDVYQVMTECKRILKTGGKLLLVFPGFYHPLEHHLSMVTRTPFLQYFFSGKDLLEVYNEIIDERGEEASWYRRSRKDLED